MFFQLVDSKQKCPYVYSNGEFSLDIPSDESLYTWNYSDILEKHNNIQYAKLYCGGREIEDICPYALKIKWKIVSQKMNAFYTSVKESKVDLASVCISDIIPKSVLKDFCEAKNEITKYAIENFKKPKNYDFLVNATKLLSQIAKNELNLKSENYPKRCLYNLFGTRTGRLSTFKNSFPILTLPKKERNIILPKNDFFVSLDYNAAEVRVTNSLLGRENIQEDLHNWHVKNIFKRNIERDKAKKEFFAWLYNPEQSNNEFERHYDRDLLCANSFQGTKVVNPFGREIECDKFHALNYLVSSTLSDIFLRQTIKINKYLKSENAKSFICFLVHDNLTFDVKKEEKEIIKKVIDIFKETCYGQYMVSVSIGKNFGEMKNV